jgi:hypothetical protein
MDLKHCPDFTLSDHQFPRCESRNRKHRVLMKLVVQGGLIRMVLGLGVHLLNSMHG